MNPQNQQNSSLGPRYSYTGTPVVPTVIGTRAQTPGTMTPFNPEYPSLELLEENFNEGLARRPIALPQTPNMYMNLYSDTDVSNTLRVPNNTQIENVVYQLEADTTILPELTDIQTLIYDVRDPNDVAMFKRFDRIAADGNLNSEIIWENTSLQDMVKFLMSKYQSLSGRAGMINQLGERAENNDRFAAMNQIQKLYKTIVDWSVAKDINKSKKIPDEIKKLLKEKKDDPDFADEFEDKINEDDYDKIVKKYFPDNTGNYSIGIPGITKYSKTHQNVRDDFFIPEGEYINSIPNEPNPYYLKPSDSNYISNIPSRRDITRTIPIMNPNKTSPIRQAEVFRTDGIDLKDNPNVIDFNLNPRIIAFNHQPLEKKITTFTTKFESDRIGITLAPKLREFKKNPNIIDTGVSKKKHLIKFTGKMLNAKHNTRGDKLQTIDITFNETDINLLANNLSRQEIQAPLSLFVPRDEKSLALNEIFFKAVDETKTKKTKYSTNFVTGTNVHTGADNPTPIPVYPQITSISTVTPSGRNVALVDISPIIPAPRPFVDPTTILKQYSHEITNEDIFAPNGNPNFTEVFEQDQLLKDTMKTLVSAIWKSQMTVSPSGYNLRLSLPLIKWNIRNFINNPDDHGNDMKQIFIPLCQKILQNYSQQSDGSVMKGVRFNVYGEVPGRQVRGKLPGQFYDRNNIMNFGIMANRANLRPSFGQDIYVLSDTRDDVVQLRQDISIRRINNINLLADDIVQGFEQYLLSLEELYERILNREQQMNIFLNGISVEFYDIKGIGDGTDTFMDPALTQNFATDYFNANLPKELYFDSTPCPSFLNKSIISLTLKSLNQKARAILYPETCKPRANICLLRFIAQLHCYHKSLTGITTVNGVINSFVVSSEFEVLKEFVLSKDKSTEEKLAFIAEKICPFNLLIVSNDWTTYDYIRVGTSLSNGPSSIAFPVAVITSGFQNYGNGEGHISFSNHFLIDILQKSMSSQRFTSSFIPRLSDKKDEFDYTHFPAKDSKICIQKYLLESIENHKDWSNNVIELIIDIETYTTGKRQPYLLCCLYEGGEFNFAGEDCIDLFFGWLKDICNDLNPVRKGADYTKSIAIWAHNGAKFDYIYFLKSKYLDNFFINGDSHNIKSMSFEFNNGLKKTSITTYDFFLTMPKSLKDLAKLFNCVEKLDNTVMLSIESIGDFRKHQEKLIEYCIRDCICLSQILSKFRATINNISKPYLDKKTNDIKYVQLRCPYTWVSAASLADKLFRSYFLYQGIKKGAIKNYGVWGLARDDYDIIKQSYFGGICMVFKKTMGSGYVYDINSSYPHQMMKLIPHKLLGKYNPTTNQYGVGCFLPDTKVYDIDDDAEDHNSDKIKLCRLYRLSQYRFPEDCYMPIFPTRTATGNIYVLSGNDTLVWDTTLVYARDVQKCVFTVTGHYLFAKANIYREWVDVFYKKKSESTPEQAAERELYKLFLNSLYGKTGEKEHNKKMYVKTIDRLQEILTPKKFNDGVTNPSNEFYAVDSIKIRGKEENEMEEEIKESTLNETGKKVHRMKTIQPRELNSIENIESIEKTPDCYELSFSPNNITPMHMGSLCYIASFITAAARLQLVSTIDMIRTNLGGEVYYCDTDSIFTDIELPPEYIHKTILGKWKLEHQIERAKFFGSKLYIYQILNGKTISKSKGIPCKYVNSEEYKEKLWELDSNNIEVDIQTTWQRKWGFVENKPLKKNVRPTLNRRIYDLENDSKPFYSEGQFHHRMKNPEVDKEVFVIEDEDL